MTWLFDNDTQRVIKQIAKRELKSEKRKNIIIILSIALAAFLMSMFGTLTFAFQQSQENLSTFEVTYLGMTQEKIAQLREKSQISMVGEVYYLGNWKTEQGNLLAFSYFDENALEFTRNQLKILTGEIPSKIEEIAVDQSFLEAYYPECKVGSTIMVPVKNKEMEFVISAITKGIKTTQGTYDFFVSHEFIKNSAAYNSANYQVYVHFKDADIIPKDELKNIGAQIGKELGAEYKYSYLFFRDETKITIGNIVLFIGIALLVIFAGIMTIQNIFQISINEKIRSYGQLRTLGTTPEQIKHIVIYESRFLFGIGVLIGIIPGIILGTLMGSNKMESGFNLWNVILVAVTVTFICWIMTRLSIYKPIKIAANTSPIEAVRYLPCVDNVKQKSIIRHKKINVFRLALLNLTRDQKKTISTLISLTLGGVLWFISAAASVTNSPEQFIKQKMFRNEGSFRLYLDGENITEQILKGNPLNKSLQQSIMEIDGVKDIIPIRNSVGFAKFKLDQIQEVMCDVLVTNKNFEGNTAYIAKNLKAGEMPNNKNEVLLTDGYLELGMASIGMPLDLTVNGETIKTKIVGFYDASFVNSDNGIEIIDAANIIITEQLAKELLLGVDNMAYSWEIITENNKNKEIQAKLESLAGVDIGISSYKNEVKNMSISMDIFFGSLQFLSIFILMFGIFNLVNMTLSNQQSRKHEISTMRSVGLTPKQLYKMLISEGMLYIAISIFVTLLIGFPISIITSGAFGTLLGMENMTYEFPYVYFGIYLIIMLLIEFFLAFWSINNLKKYTLVELIRAVE